MESDKAVEDVMRQFGFSPDWGFVEESPLEQLDEALDAVMPTASFTGIFRILIPTLKTTF